MILNKIRSIKSLPRITIIAGLITLNVSAQESNEQPVFNTVGTITGIDVIVQSPPENIKPDRAIEALLSRGVSVFHAGLKAQLKNAGINAGASKQKLTDAISDPDVLLSLSRYELVRSVGEEALGEVLKRREGKEFLASLLSSQGWLDDLLVSGPLGGKNAATTLHALCSIYRYDKECTLPLYRKLACAHARIYSGDWKTDAFHYTLLDRFQAQKKIHQRGRMHGSFDKMESWEMLWVAGTRRMGDSRALHYMADRVHYRRGSYYGACWTTAYRLNNFFGDSIHGRSYYSPWVNEYYGEPLRNKVGGVCGTLSNFGAGLARAHGIPSFPAGQPGHCAYMLRAGDESWGTAYSVTGNTGAGTFFGGGDESIVRLTQAAYSNQNRSELLKSYRYNWQAHFLQDNSTSLTKGERNARELSLNEQRLHYNHWRWYVERLAASKTTVKASDWDSLSRQFVKSVGHYQRPCFTFLTQFMLPPVEKLPLKDRSKVILGWYEELPKKGLGIHNIGGRHFPGHLARHAKALGTEPKYSAAFLKKMLDCFEGTPHFTMVLSWGQKTLAKDKEGTKEFVSIIHQFSKNNKEASKGFTSVLGQIILDAEKRGDVETIVATSKLGDSLFAEDKEFVSIYHTSRTVLETKAPKSEKKFSGKLLSANAHVVLQHPYDTKTALAHRAALQPDRLGFVITKKVKNAHIDLKLPGHCNLSGMSLIPRFESARDRSFPMKVSVSMDGKTWEQVGLFEKPENLCELDLSKTRPKAEWIRFERNNDAVNFFELRSIKVYGSTNY